MLRAGLSTRSLQISTKVINRCSLKYLHTFNVKSSSALSFVDKKISETYWHTNTVSS